MDNFIPPFLQLDFQITGRCNSRCTFCNCWKNPYSAEKDIPGVVWVETVKKLKGFTNIEYLCIGGGEPLLYRDIFNLLRGMTDLNVHTIMVSNGSLFSRETCRKILDTGLDQIDLSMDGFEKTHDRLRGMPGSFKKCIDSIFRLKKLAPGISLGISSLICGENLHELPEFLDWVLRELPIDRINFQAYQQVTEYKEKRWWETSALWPNDEKTVIHSLDYLAEKTQNEKKITNHPLQCEKFKRYFLNPQSNLGIDCPAGAFNFSVSHTGDVIGCIAMGPVGNIKHADAVDIYQKKFSDVRKRAVACKENCHFLINCYFPLHWSRWEHLIKKMVTEDTESICKPGPIVLPPEIREITKTGDYPDLISYEAHEYLDSMETIIHPESRVLPESHPWDIPCVYLCGDTSEIHRWAVNLDEEDFFKQIDFLKQLISQRALHHIIVGVTRTNFHRLNKIFHTIRELKHFPLEIPIPRFSVTPLQGIKERFHKYFDRLKTIGQSKGIEFRVVDQRFDELLSTIEVETHNDHYNKGELLRALGPVLKDVFIGPKFLLLDLSGKCNLDCVYCRGFSNWNREFIDSKPESITRFLGLAVIRNILQEAKETGVECILLVGGGEPTLHPDFLEIIGQIKELNLKFNFSTNGTLLDRYNEYILDGSCESVTVSLSYASNGTFKKLRPGSNPKLAQKIEKSIRRLSTMKKAKNTVFPNIIVLFAICRYNCHEIIPFVEFAKKLGANAIWYQMVHLEDFSKSKLMPSPEKMLRINKDLKTAKQLCQQHGIKFSSFIDFELERYDERHGDWSKGGLLEQGCFVGWHFSFIFLRAEVYFCCGARTIGYLDNDGKGFRDLWFSDTYKRYRNDGLILHEENPICLNGRMLYDKYCDSCDNHDQNNIMINLLKRYNLFTFVQRHKEKSLIHSEKINDPIRPEIPDGLPAISDREDLVVNISSSKRSTNILLVMPPPWGVNNPPIPLGYLAQHLKDNGIGYEIFDLNLALFNRSGSDKKALWDVESDCIWRNTPSDEMISQLDGFEELLSRIIDSDSTVVGFSLVDPNQFISCHVIKKIKKECPRKFIVVGGPVCATVEERIWLRDNTNGLIDFIVVGEGEKPLLALLRKLDAPPTSKEIVLPGVVDCQYNEDMTPHSMDPPLDLTEISFPDYKGFPLDLYGENVATVMWSRGCISNCAFCKEKSLWDKHRTRAIADITGEIRFYIAKGISEFVVYDSLVNGRPEQLELLCDTIISSQLIFRWSALAIPNRSLSKALLKKMKLAGCFVLIFGLESGSEKILRRMRKRFSLEEAIETIKNTKHAGIQTAINIIVGFPGETEVEFKETCDFLKRYQPYIDRIDAITPLQLVKGTYLFNHYEKSNITMPRERAYEFWSTTDGMNTHEIRMERRKKVVDICQRFGIPIGKAFGTEKEKGKSRVEGAANADHGLDIVFFDQTYPETLDYDTAAILEYLKQCQISVAYLGASRISDVYSKLEQTVVNVVAVKTSPENHEDAIKTAKSIKKKNRRPKVVLWGSGCRTSGMRKDVPTGFVDGIIFQEYEAAFRRLVSNLRSRPMKQPTPGICISNRPFIPLNPARNLDKYPFPRYKEFSLNKQTIDALPLKLSKGCPHRCLFCSIYHEEGHFRVRSAHLAYEAMRYHFEKNEIRRFAFEDRAINGNPDRLYELCNILTKEKSPITWKGKYIVQRGNDNLLFREMADAGCTQLNFGFISGSNHVLKLMEKPFDVKDLENSLKNAKASGIQNQLRLMIGYPGEEDIDLMETISFLIKNRKCVDAVDLIAPFYLQPGSTLQITPENYDIFLPRNNPFRDWHNGSYNNSSYRLKKLKEVAIVLKELNFIPSLTPYIGKGEEILETKDKICKRYLGFSEKRRVDQNMGLHLNRNGGIVRDPVIKGIQTGKQVFAAPETLEIDLTNNCNLNCLGCWCHSPLLGEDKFSGKTKRQYLPTDKILSVLKEVGELGRPTTIQLSGAGEPFLHPDIWDIIEAIKGRQMSCQIITNFSLLDKRGVRRLVDLGVDAVTASIWAGDLKTYGRNHPGAPPDLFDRIQENLANLTELRGARRLPKLKIYHVVNINNANDINSMTDFALQVGADAVEFQMMDVVPGKTDVIRLDRDAKKNLLTQFKMLQHRSDYTEAFIGANHLRCLDSQILKTELKEFGRLYPHLPKGFQYCHENLKVRCPKGFESIEKTLSHAEFSVTFSFDRHKCKPCGQRESCWGDHAEFSRLRVYPMNILGAGSFLRRLTYSRKDIQEYERHIVDQLPCTVGWTYSRIKVDGHVIPCCKASDFPLGNINEASFSNIWNTRSYSTFRQKAKMMLKSDPYFSKINCYKSCDNVGMNLNTYFRLLNSKEKYEEGGSQ